jgi:hypothetical protein
LIQFIAERGAGTVDFRLFDAQRPNGIDGSRAPGWDKTGQQGTCGQHLSAINYQ